MYIINNNKAEKVEVVTFKELDMKENDIEEILRCNIDMLCGEEESMLIVGRQVKNEKLGRSDLTAVDNNGSLVLIEIKRDMKDFESKKEAIEFQAIRYAASYATIETPEELVEKVFAPYIEKYRSEFEIGELTTFELGIRKLNEFLEENQAGNDFNKKQKIILAASDYDDQTLSAVAWLNNNGFTTMSLEEVYEAFETGKVPVRPVAITFDDGYADNYTEAYPILKKYGMKATFFIITFRFSIYIKHRSLNHHLTNKKKLLPEKSYD